MTEPQTQKHFNLTNDFQATDAIAVIFAAGVFDSVKKYETKGIKKIEDLQKQIEKGLTITDGISALPEVYKDAFELTEAFKRYKIGMEENKTLFFLTDVREKKEINEVCKDLKHRAQSNPDSKILIFYACAGHGMQIDGEQVLVVN